MKKRAIGIWFILMTASAMHAVAVDKAAVRDQHEGREIYFQVTLVQVRQVFPRWMRCLVYAPKP